MRRHLDVRELGALLRVLELALVLGERQREERGVAPCCPGHQCRQEAACFRVLGVTADGDGV
eukprot:10528449-Lingulodinium_polyedra.AAC.1